MTVFQDLNIDQYRERFGGAEHQLIDVRMPDEYEAGHLPGAVNIPLPEVQWRMDEISEDIPVVMVCNTGSRSAMSSDMLVASGYDEVYNLIDGTEGWVRRQLPIER